MILMKSAIDYNVCAHLGQFEPELVGGDGGEGVRGPGEVVVRQVVVQAARREHQAGRRAYREHICVIK